MPVKIRRPHFPFIEKIDRVEDPFSAYCSFASSKDGASVLLESARFSKRTGRYSIAAKDPFLIFQSKGRKIKLERRGKTETVTGDPFKILKALLQKYATSARPGLPPFSGGAVGYFGYEAKNILEPRLTQKAKDDLCLPDSYFLFFDQGVVWDHEARVVYLFAPSPDGLKKLKAEFDSVIASRVRGQSLNSDIESCQNLRTDPYVYEPNLKSSLNRQEFIERVRKVKSYIRSGDIYQANISQRFSFDVDATARKIYGSLRRINPSPFFGILDAGDFQIVSGSPERLVKLENGILETRPIAGTRSRGKTSEEDSALSRELILNEKERAEHIMLVDLERNDLGRVCEHGSVSVDELMAIEDYSHVKHIVSNVRGILRDGLDAVDVLKALFPGGTITGAPKVRCMEIIDELEPVARGPYTGSLGYFSFDGSMDFNIVIRSLVMKDKKAYLHVGAGIVADSDPGREYDETLYKAEAVFSALFGRKKTGQFTARNA